MHQSKRMESSSPRSVPLPPSGEPSARPEPVRHGLEGVLAAETRLSHVDGHAGRLVLGGYDVGELAPRCSFEAVAYLLLHDRLPAREEERDFAAAVARERVLPELTLQLLASAASAGAAPIDALRLGAASLAIEVPRVERLLGALPSIVASYERLQQGLPLVAPDPRLSAAASFLWLLRGTEPAPREARALETYWNTVSDHGLNASTFTARVIASTGSDLGSAILGALGALKGPLHGGAPGPALEVLLRLRGEGGDIGARTRHWALGELSAGRRLMGFGHRVYRVRDPRADVLRAAARELLVGSDLLDLAERHEQAVLEVLREHKPGRRLDTNVEFYTALLLHGLGFGPALFTPVFALGRLAGWLAHDAEQRARGRLIRPDARYVGALGRTLDAAGAANGG